MDEKIVQILNKRGLRLIKTIKSPDGGLVRSYIYILENSRGKKYVLKYFDSHDDDAKNRFIREVRVIRKLRSKLPTRYQNWIVKIKWFSLNRVNPYYIYDYVEGHTIGEFVKDFGIKWGQFKDKNFDIFIKFFTNLSYIGLDNLKTEIGVWDSYYIDKELEHYFKYLPDSLDENLKENIEKFYNKKKEDVFKKMAVSHRDLYPENIILREPFTDKFTFLDFEYLSKVPIGYDAAFLYLLFWKGEYWKGKIFSYYYNYYKCDIHSGKRLQFITSFRFCLIILGIRFLYQIESWGDRYSEDFDKVKMNILFDIESALNNTISRPRNIKFYVTRLDLQKISDSYHLGDIKSYHIFYASKGNTVAKVYICGHKNPYIFRLYSQLRSRSLIKRELSILRKLCENGIKTYRVIPNPSGSLYSNMLLYGINQRVAVLSYVRGKKIEKSWADEKAGLNAGMTLRKIHDLDVVHGDYSKENVSYIKNYVSGVIDFEWGRHTKSYEAKLSDLARAIALWLVDVRYKQIDDNEFTLKFLEGYMYRKPQKRDLLPIIERVIDKIEEERNVFLRTGNLVGVDRKFIGARFDKAISKVSRMIEDE